MQPVSFSDCLPDRGADLSQRTDNPTADLADVERVLCGDAGAFAGIVRRWQGPLVNMAWRYCRDRSRAEEMAQEAFLRAWRGLAQWRRESSFSTWPFSLAANVYRTELKRFPEETLPIEEAREPSHPAGQLQAVLMQRCAETVRRAVLALPMRYREPVILFYFQEMDLSLAAATMGMPEGTMKARLSRARALLRRRFPQLEALHGEAEQTALGFSTLGTEIEIESTVRTEAGAGKEATQ
jgi:RNA polymerase sigma-70 factor (ECF subfamily)